MLRYDRCMRGLLEVVYRRFPPPPEQRAYVEHIWMVEAPGGAKPKREILIPNGRPTVVVSLGRRGVRHDPLTATRHPNGNVLFGITTRPYVLEQRGASSYVGAQLRPWGLAALLPRDRLVDQFLPLEGWLGGDATKRLVQQLAGREFGEPRAQVLGAFLQTRLTPIGRGALALLRSAVAVIDQTNGLVTVTELAAKLGVSYSSVYRLCKDYLGVGPKQLCEITRYYHFVGGLLGEAHGDSDALLACLHGYYDQAHAARSFKRFTGVSATSFKQLHHGIAQLMHAWSG
jgi:AraC-like DNA-binding protein